MASEDLNHGDTPPRKVGKWAVRKKASIGTGITNGGRVDMHVPYTVPPVSSVSCGDISETPQSCTQDTPVTGAQRMSNFSQFNSSQKGNSPFLYMPVPDFSCSEMDNNGLCQHQSLVNSMSAGNVIDDATQFNSFMNPQIPRELMSVRNNAGGSLCNSMQDEINGGGIHVSQLSKSSISSLGSIPLLCQTPGGGQARFSNNVMVNTDYTVQPNFPVELDGSFLTLGTGGNTEAIGDMTSNAERNIPPQSSISPKGSSLTPGLNLAGGFSSFPNYLDGFSDFAQNMDDWTMSDTDLGIENLSQFHVSKTQEVDRQHHFPMPSNMRLNLEGNMDAISAKREMHQSLQGYLLAPTEPLNGSKAGLPKSRHIGVTGLPFVPSITSAHPQPAYDKLMKSSMETARAFWPEPSKNSPFVDPTGRMHKQDQLGLQFLVHQGAAAQTAAAGLFPPKIGLQQAKKPVRAGRGGTLQLVEGDLLPKNIGVQQASNHGQSQSISHVHPSKNLLGPGFTTGQEMPGDNGHFPAQASNVYCGLKRGAMQTPPATPQTQRRRTKTTQSSPYPYNPVPNLTNSAPSFTPLPHTSPSLPPVAHPSSALLPFSQHAQALPPPTPRTRVLQRQAMTNQALRRLVQTSSTHPLVSQTAPALQRLVNTAQASPPPPKPAPALPPKASHVPSVYIKRKDLDTPPSLMGTKCLLSKRDLTFTPDGPVSQPTIPPAVAVLPCGHTFHDNCLKKITPKDEAENPPCIPCVVGES